MSDMQLELKVKRIVTQSGFVKSKDMLCPIMKIIQMRHKDISKKQIIRVTKLVLK